MPKQVQPAKADTKNEEKADKKAKPTGRKTGARMYSDYRLKSGVTTLGA
jgi:hypothetical protein